jgi:hypothetical protein
MATATYAQFVAAVQDLNVTGVNRKHTEPPQKFNTADLPSSFVWFPQGDNKPLMFGGGREFKSRAVDLIVIYAETAVTVDMPFAATVTMMDAVETALNGLSVGFSQPTWIIESKLFDQTADKRYWAVVATISGKG